MHLTIQKISAILFFTFISFNQILAGPGGKIAKSLFDTVWGKILLAVIAIILLPIIIYINLKEYIGKKKTKKDLKELAKSAPKVFDEITLKNRFTDVFSRVHKAWSNKDMSDCSSYMSDWYRQNQQLVYLDTWKEQNLENICTIKRVNSMAPLHVRISGEDNFEESRIMVQMDAHMEDYLVNIDTQKVVEGKKGFKDVETVWTFVFDEGQWKVDNIEQSEVTTEYAKMENIIPDNLSPSS